MLKQDNKGFDKLPPCGKIMEMEKKIEIDLVFQINNGELQEIVNCQNISLAIEVKNSM